MTINILCFLLGVAVGVGGLLTLAAHAFNPVPRREL